MGKLNKKQMPMWAKTGHQKPVTRREFLAAGLIPFAASAFVPGALGLLGTPFAANAAECTDPAQVLAPFITLNLSGGAALMANLLPRDQGFQPLPNYQSLGYPSQPTMVNAYGSPSWSSTSGVLAGLNSIITDQSVRDKVQVIQVSVSSVDDTNSNRFDVSGMVYAAGLAGTLMPNLGRRSSVSGINQQSALVNPPRPLVVATVNDIVNSLGYTASLNAAALSPTQKQKLATLVGNLSASQAEKLSRIRSVAHVKDLVECAGIKNSSVVGASAALVNPFATGANSSQQQIATVWNSGTALASNQVFGAMVYNGLVGQAGTVNLELGGYDYHDGTRTTGDRMDNEAGQQIGKIIQSANILGKKVAVYLTSDGSTAAGGGGIWVSDRGQAGSAMLFLFDPAGRPQLVSGATPQIGHYESNGSQQVVASSLVSDPQNAAVAAFRNYIAFNGQSALSRFDKVGSSFSRDQLDQITKIMPK